MACQNRSNLPQAPFYHFSGQRMVPLTESLAVVLTFPKSRSTINFMGFNCDISHWCLQIYIYIYIYIQHFERNKTHHCSISAPQKQRFYENVEVVWLLHFLLLFSEPSEVSTIFLSTPKVVWFFSKNACTNLETSPPIPPPVAVVLHGVVVAWPAAGLANDPCAALGQRGANSGERKLWISHHLRCWHSSPHFFSAAKWRGKNCCGEWFGWLCIFFFGKKKKRLGWNWMVNIVFGNFWRHVFFTIYTKKRSPDLSDEFQGICNVYQPVINPSLDKKHGDFWLRSLRLILLLDSAENDCIGLDFQQKIHKIQIRDTFQSLKIHWSPLRTRDLERVFPFNFSPFCFPTFLQK